MRRLRLVIAQLILVGAALLAVFSPSTVRITSAQTPTINNDQDLARGIEFYKQGRYSEAAKLLKIVANKNKSDAQAWYNLGLALVQQEKEVKNASKAFETALKLRPNFAEAHAGLAYSLLVRDKISEAFIKEIVGTVILRAVFAADGTVNHILVIKSLPGGLTQKSVEAARRHKFIRAMLNGRPVSMFLQLE